MPLKLVLNPPSSSGERTLLYQIEELYDFNSRFEKNMTAISQTLNVLSLNANAPSNKPKTTGPGAKYAWDKEEHHFTDPISPEWKVLFENLSRLYQSISTQTLLQNPKTLMDTNAQMDDLFTQIESNTRTKLNNGIELFITASEGYQQLSILAQVLRETNKDARAALDKIEFNTKLGQINQFLARIELSLSSIQSQLKKNIESAIQEVSENLNIINKSLADFTGNESLGIKNMLERISTQLVALQKDCAHINPNDSAQMQSLFRKVNYLDQNYASLGTMLKRGIYDRSVNSLHTPRPDSDVSFSFSSELSSSESEDDVASSIEDSDRDNIEPRAISKTDRTLEIIQESRSQLALISPALSHLLVIHPLQKSIAQQVKVYNDNVAAQPIKDAEQKIIVKLLINLEKERQMLAKQISMYASDTIGCSLFSPKESKIKMRLDAVNKITESILHGVNSKQNLHAIAEMASSLQHQHKSKLKNKTGTFSVGDSDVWKALERFHNKAEALTKTSESGLKNS